MKLRIGKIPQVAKILVGFVLGTVLGTVVSECCQAETVGKVVPWVAPFGDVLVAMLKAVVCPVILFSLVVGASSLPLRKSGRVGGMVIAWYFATSVFATFLGVALAYLLNPSMANARHVASANMKAVAGMSAAGASGSIGSFVASLFQNPFYALSSGQLLPVILFAVGFGLCARWLLDSSGPEGRKGVEAVLALCDGAQRISFKMVDCVILYFPIGVFALSFVNFANNGLLLFGPYAKIAASVIAGVCTMMLVVYPLAIALFCRENPYRVLLRMREPLVAAFVTRSSAATLPVSFKSADALGVSRGLSSFSLPLGATINMDGVCVHLPVFVILAANMFGHSLGVVEIATLCASIVFASIGAGGIPGGSLFLLFMVLENMGLPSDQVTVVVALCLGINPLLDMFETCCNVTGDNVCTYIVAKKAGFLSNA